MFVYKKRLATELIELSILGTPHEGPWIGLDFLG